MTPLRLRFVRTALIAVAVAAAGLSAGCSRMLPMREGTAHSYEMVIDTRRDPVPQLSGCFIPATFPAVTRIPVIFVQPIPPGAIFVSVTHEVLLKNGDPLALLESSIENNQVFLKFAVSKIDAFSQTQVLVRVKYQYR
jgi:hypothetical protein